MAARYKGGEKRKGPVRFPGGVLFSLASTRNVRNGNPWHFCSPAGFPPPRVIFPKHFLLAIGAAYVLLAGCGRSSAPKKRTIACIPKAVANTYWQSVRVGAERAGRELNVNIDWQGPVNDSKVADQISIFDNLTASGVDGILLSPCDDRALRPHVRQAMKRGLPVAIVDSELDGQPGTDFIGFVGTNNHQAGATAAQTLARAIGDAPAYGGKVLVIRFTEGSSSTRVREEGFLESLTAANPRLKIVDQQFTDGSMAGAQRVAETLLNNYVKDRKIEVDGVFASNLPTAEGAYAAIKALRDEGIEVRTKFVGFDDSDLLDEGLRNGTITALVVQDTETMGYLGVKLLVDSLDGKPVARKVDTPVTVKTAPGEPAKK